MPKKNNQQSLEQFKKKNKQLAVYARINQVLGVNLSRGQKAILFDERLEGDDAFWAEVENEAFKDKRLQSHLSEKKKFDIPGQEDNGEQNGGQNGTNDGDPGHLNVQNEAEAQHNDLNHFFDVNVNDRDVYGDIDPNELEEGRNTNEDDELNRLQEEIDREDENNTQNGQDEQDGQNDQNDDVDQEEIQDEEAPDPALFEGGDGTLDPKDQKAFDLTVARCVEFGKPMNDEQAFRFESVIDDGDPSDAYWTELKDQAKQEAQQQNIQRPKDGKFGTLDPEEQRKYDYQIAEKRQYVVVMHDTKGQRLTVDEQYRNNTAYWYGEDQGEYWTGLREEAKQKLVTRKNEEIRRKHQNGPFAQNTLNSNAHTNANTNSNTNTNTNTANTGTVNADAMAPGADGQPNAGENTDQIAQNDQEQFNRDYELGVKALRNGTRSLTPEEKARYDRVFDAPDEDVEMNNYTNRIYQKMMDEIGAEEVQKNLAALREDEFFGPETVENDRAIFKKAILQGENALSPEETQRLKTVSSLQGERGGQYFDSIMIDLHNDQEVGQERIRRFIAEENVQTAQNAVDVNSPEFLKDYEIVRKFAQNEDITKEELQRFDEILADQQSAYTQILLNTLQQNGVQVLERNNPNDEILREQGDAPRNNSIQNNNDPVREEEEIGNLNINQVLNEHADENQRNADLALVRTIMNGGRLTEEQQERANAVNGDEPYWKGIFGQIQNEMGNANVQDVVLQQLMQDDIHQEMQNQNQNEQQNPPQQIDHAKMRNDLMDQFQNDDEVIKRSTVIKEVILNHKLRPEEVQLANNANLNQVGTGDLEETKKWVTAFRLAQRDVGDDDFNAFVNKQGNTNDAQLNAQFIPGMQNVIQNIDQTENHMHTQMINQGIQQNPNNPQNNLNENPQNNPQNMNINQAALDAMHIEDDLEDNVDEQENQEEPFQEDYDRDLSIAIRIKLGTNQNENVRNGLYTPEEVDRLDSIVNSQDPKVQAYFQRVIQGANKYAEDYEISKKYLLDGREAMTEEEQARYDELFGNDDSPQMVAYSNLILMGLNIDYGEENLRQMINNRENLENARENQNQNNNLDGNPNVQDGVDVNSAQFKKDYEIFRKFAQNEKLTPEEDGRITELNPNYDDSYTMRIMNMLVENGVRVPVWDNPVQNQQEINNQNDQNNLEDNQNINQNNIQDNIQNNIENNNQNNIHQNDNPDQEEDVEDNLNINQVLNEHADENQRNADLALVRTIMNGGRLTEEQQERANAVNGDEPYWKGIFGQIQNEMGNANVQDVVLQQLMQDDIHQEMQNQNQNEQQNPPQQIDHAKMRNDLMDQFQNDDEVIKRSTVIKEVILNHKLRPEEVQLANNANLNQVGTGDLEETKKWVTAFRLAQRDVGDDDFNAFVNKQGNTNDAQLNAQFIPGMQNVIQNIDQTENHMHTQMINQAIQQNPNNQQNQNDHQDQNDNQDQNNLNQNRQPVQQGFTLQNLCTEDDVHKAIVQEINANPQDKFAFNTLVNQYKSILSGQVPNGNAWMSAPYQFITQGNNTTKEVVPAIRQAAIEVGQEKVSAFLQGNVAMNQQVQIAAPALRQLMIYNNLYEDNLKQQMQVAKQQIVPPQQGVNPPQNANPPQQGVNPPQQGANPPQNQQNPFMNPMVNIPVMMNQNPIQINNPNQNLQQMNPVQQGNMIQPINLQIQPMPAPPQNLPPQLQQYANQLQQWANQLQMQQQQLNNYINQLNQQAGLNMNQPGNNMNNPNNPQNNNQLNNNPNNNLNNNPNNNPNNNQDDPQNNVQRRNTVRETDDQLEGKLEEYKKESRIDRRSQQQIRDEAKNSLDPNAEKFYKLVPNGISVNREVSDRMMSQVRKLWIMADRGAVYEYTKKDKDGNVKGGRSYIKAGIGHFKKNSPEYRRILKDLNALDKFMQEIGGRTRLTKEESLLFEKLSLKAYKSTQDYLDKKEKEKDMRELNGKKREKNDYEETRIRTIQQVQKELGEFREAVYSNVMKEQVKKAQGSLQEDLKKVEEERKTIAGAGLGQDQIKDAITDNVAKTVFYANKMDGLSKFEPKVRPGDSLMGTLRRLENSTQPTDADMNRIKGQNLTKSIVEDAVTKVQNNEAVTNEGIMDQQKHYINRMSEKIRQNQLRAQQLRPVNRNLSRNDSMVNNNPAM